MLAINTQGVAAREGKITNAWQRLGGEGGIRKSKEGGGRGGVNKERGVLTQSCRLGSFQRMDFGADVRFQDVQLVQGEPCVCCCGFGE